MQKIFIKNLKDQDSSKLFLGIRQRGLDNSKYNINSEIIF